MNPNELINEFFSSFLKLITVKCFAKVFKKEEGLKIMDEVYNDILYSFDPIFQDIAKTDIATSVEMKKIIFNSIDKLKKEIYPESIIKPE